MLRLLFIFLLSILFSAANAQDVWTNKKRVLPDLLRKVPVALYIKHSPNPNYPERNNSNKKGTMKYIWKHATTVFGMEKDLTVIEAGSFIWYNESGWKQNVQYNKKNFAKKFNCPKGKLKKGESYTFVKNYRYGNAPYGGDALWFVLAKDKEGTIYKGMAIIETESEVK